jgi:capsular polysaccharide biosynthesis protein
MAGSIQEFCKKINSRISLIDIVAILFVFFFLLVAVTLIGQKKSENSTNVVYEEGVFEGVEGKSKDIALNQPFGSKYGTTYTFTWCQGSGRILEKNRVYFSSTQDAEASGRRLSKLCKK